MARIGLLITYLTLAARDTPASRVSCRSESPASGCLLIIIYCEGVNGPAKAFLPSLDSHSVENRAGEEATTLTVKWPVPLSKDLTESAIIERVLDKFLLRN